MILTPEERASLVALKTELRTQARGELLREINGWLLDQAELADVDGAEWDAAFCRQLAVSLAKRFAA